MPPVNRPLTLADAVDELLGTIELEECDPEVLGALRVKAEKLAKEAIPYSPGMTPQQRALLIRTGAFTAAELAETEDSVARGDLRDEEHRTELEMIAASYGESEVVKRLGLGRSEIHDRLRAGGLYAFEAAGTTVYPKWQFTDQTDDGLLPHLAHVVRSSPR